MTTDVMRVTVNLGMVNIDAPGISYVNIANMCRSGHGCGLQMDEHLEPMRKEINDLCDTVADKIYELQWLAGT